MCIRWTKFPSKWNGAISLCKHRIVCNSMFWFLNCFLYLRFYRLSRTHTHTHSGHVVKQNFNKQEKKLCINDGHRRTISDGNFQLMWQYWLNDEKRKTKFAGKSTENKSQEKKKTNKQRISNIAAWRENGIVDGDRMVMALHSLGRKGGQQQWHKRLQRMNSRRTNSQHHRRLKMALWESKRQNKCSLY